MSAEFVKSKSCPLSRILLDNEVRGRLSYGVAHSSCAECFYKAVVGISSRGGDFESLREAAYVEIERDLLSRGVKPGRDCCWLNNQPRTK